MDEVYTIPVETSDRGRKRKRTDKPPSKSRSTRYKCDGKQPSVSCNHSKGKQGCNAAILLKHDIEYFFKKVYQQGSKTMQDRFLITFMHVGDSQRSRKRKEDSVRRKPIQVNYFALQKNGRQVKVCAKSFQSLTCTSRDRLARIARAYKTCGSVQNESRGGMDQKRKEKHQRITESIIQHIKLYRCRESHYGRTKSVRHYLPPDLSVKKMWRQWKVGQKDKVDLCSYNKFLKVFVTRFNLGFGNPRSDICSYCEEQTKKLTLAKTEIDKNNIILDKRIHKQRARRFYQMLKHDPPGTITVAFDCQQNQPLPKLSVSDTFYSRQVWFYNLTMMVYHGQQKKEDHIMFYTWLETQHGRGSNEVASALIHYLQCLEDKIPSDVKVVRLFSDSAASQNKNSTVLGALCGYMQATSRWEKVEHIFPVRGHSFMPPDRVFGRVEKILRKKEIITSPLEYNDILLQHGMVAKCEIDWQVKDYKSLAKSHLKAVLPFKISQQKVITYNKRTSGVNVSVQALYGWGETSCVVLKKGHKFLHYLQCAEIIAPENKVSSEKASDVEKLLKFFTVPEDAQEFYKAVLSATKGRRKTNNTKFNDSDDVVVYEDEPQQ